MSLRRIALKDFVIVEALDIELSNGFTALTGETGAGKSILIDAVQIALGQRADAGVIRHGGQRCEIVLELDSNEAVDAWLADNGFDVHDDEPILLRRQIDTQGRSRAWINASPATMTQLRSVGDALVDIHGQHAWQTLGNTAAQRQLLDAYAGASTAEVAAAWQAWHASAQALDAARTRQLSIAQDTERLQWQLGELAKLSPQANEWATLNEDHTRLSHAQALIDAAQLACNMLDDDNTNAATLLSNAIAALGKQVHIEPQFASVVEVLNQAQALVEDATHSLHTYLRRADLDPQRLAELDERVALWLSHARRLRCLPEDLPALVQSWTDELAQLTQASDLEAMQQTVAKHQAALTKACKALTAKRQKAAKPLAQEITQAMQSLGMQGGVFEVALTALDQPSATGQDHIEFLVAGHPGVPTRALGKVASGGELSRIALAIAVCTSRLGKAPTLIFDEVDSGIGGQVAQTVGALMQRLGADRQVLTVTHLAQVAASANEHLVVSKARDTDKTISHLAVATDQARVVEIARMLGGDTNSQASLAHAQEMLKTAAKPK
ncbi:DNA repair protein RecN [Comamonadaceae bacterium M7527]|nr:DNA repair protein RecN [Comamonadaceae bacterium M7527]